MGTTCNPTYPTTSSIDQGAQFAKMTAAFHGGSRKRSSKSRGGARKSLRRNKKMVRSRRSTRRMRGGSYFASYADYPTSFSTMLPTEIRDLARVAPLDAKFAELPAVERAAGVMAGGGRRRTRRHRGGAAPIDASPVILTTPEELAAARLNPQFYTENTVIPNFRGDIPYNGGVIPAPSPPPMPKVGGGRRRRGGGSCVPGTVFSSKKAAMASGCAWTDDKGVFKVAEPLISNNNAYSRGGGSCVPGTVFSDRKAAIASGCAWTDDKGVFKVAEPLISNNNYTRGGRRR